MEEKRYYYKTEDGKSWWSLKSPDQPVGSVEISKEEWDAHIEEITPKEEE